MECIGVKGDNKMKRCYVCGANLEGKFYYQHYNTYICMNNECYHFYYWDNLASQMIVDTHHEYAIINRTVYQISNNKNEPRGFGGRTFYIRFFDGEFRETNSLWRLGELPERLQHDFPDNAQFMEKVH